MAKRGRRRRSNKVYLKGQVNETLDLGTLGADALVVDTFDEVVEESSLLSSIVATWSLDGIVAGQGPILFGVAHSDYTAAEIEEVLENTGAWKQGDKISQEKAKRLVRIIGTFVGTQGTGTNDAKWNDGRPVKTKLNWRLQTGQTLDMWAYNISQAALTTAAPKMRAVGHVNLWQ